MSDDDTTVIVCGPGPKAYDPNLKSSDGACPHCGAIGELESGYGFGTGGFASYCFCTACGRFCDRVPDPDDAPPDGEEAKP